MKHSVYALCVWLSTLPVDHRGLTLPQDPPKRNFLQTAQTQHISLLFGVQDTCCQIHSAALYHFYWRWRTQKRSIEHTELTFNEVRASARRRVVSFTDPSGINGDHR